MSPETSIQVIMWLVGVIGVIVAALIAVVIYIWKSYTTRQDNKGEKQEAFNDVIIESFATLNTTIKHHEKLHGVHFDNHKSLSDKVEKLRT